MLPMRMRFVLTLGIVCGLQLFAHRPALACSCASGSPTAQSLLSSATAIFTGVARRSRAARAGESITVFEVTESFKGTAAGQMIEIHHRSGPSPACGVEFLEGESHTLAAYRAADQSDLAASLCSVWMFRVPSGATLIEEIRHRSIAPAAPEAQQPDPFTDTYRRLDAINLQFPTLEIKAGALVETIGFLRADLIPMRFKRFEGDASFILVHSGSIPQKRVSVLSAQCAGDPHPWGCKARIRGVLAPGAVNRHTFDVIADRIDVVESN